jgi:H+/Cl- antiporter ClcA
MWQSFVCAMTAAVTLQAFDPFRSGKLVLYQVTYSTGWHGFEMIPFAILGILGVSISFPLRMSDQLMLPRVSMAACSLK